MALNAIIEGKNSFERAFEAFVMQSIKKQKSRAGKDA